MIVKIGNAMFDSSEVPMMAHFDDKEAEVVAEHQQIVSIPNSFPEKFSQNALYGWAQASGKPADTLENEELLDAIRALPNENMSATMPVISAAGTGKHTSKEEAD